jgi:hypothetical protein
MDRRALAAALPLALCFASAAPLPACAALSRSTALPALAAARVAPIADTIQSLHQVPVEDLDTDVPAAVRPLLTQLKHELRDLVVERLSTFSGDRPASTLKAELVEALRQQGVHLGETKEKSPYGDILDLQTERPAAHPELLAVTIILDVMCGADSSLYVFRHEAAAWKLILAQESNGYDTVAGAQNLFDYSFSPRRPGEGWFVLVSGVNAWCTSNWQSLRFKVLRPGANPDEPKVVLSSSQTIFGADYTARIDRDTVSLVFQGAMGLDIDVMVREHVVRYRVEGDQATRIPPLATKPEDFLDEWVALPWAEARRWAAPAPKLQSWHTRLDPTQPASRAHTSVRSGKASRPGRWWVQLCLEGKGLPAGLYFLVSKQHGVYRMEAVQTKFPPRFHPTLLCAEDE